jgi:hypothetical protein
MGDFSVVLFRPNFMRPSEEHPMKTHKNQWLLNVLFPPDIPCGATSQGQTMMSGVQSPSQGPDRGRSPEMWAYNLLRTKYFHGVLSGNKHPYLLRSRYGKVRFFDEGRRNYGFRISYPHIAFMRDDPQHFLCVG